MTYFGSLRFFDEQDYFDIAKTLSRTGVFGYAADEPTALRPPGYVFFLTALMQLSDNIMFLQSIQVILWGICAGLTTILTRRLHGVEASAIALILCLVYPTFAFAATTLYPQIPMAALMLGVLVIVLDPDKGRLSTGELIGLCLLVSSLMLFNPLMIFIVLGVFPILLWIRRAPVWQAGLPIVLTLMVIMIWIARNEAVLGAEMTIATNLGINMILGNSEFAAPNLGTTTDISDYLSQAEGLDEVARNEFFKASAIAWIQANPADALALYGAKFLNYFNYANKLATADEQSGLRDAILFVAYYTILGATFLRLTLTRRLPLNQSECVLLAIYILAGLAYSVFFNRVRFRLPFDYLLIVLASAWGGHVLERFWPRAHSH
jgi:hypothetical protein